MPDKIILPPTLKFPIGLNNTAGTSKGYILLKILFIVSWQTKVRIFLFEKVGHLTHNADIVSLSSDAQSLHVLTNYLHHTLHSNDT